MPPPPLPDPGEDPLLVPNDHFTDRLQWQSKLAYLIAWWQTLSRQKKGAIVCCGFALLYMWRNSSNIGAYSPEKLETLISKDVDAAKKQLEETWITVTGPVYGAAYFKKPSLFVRENTSEMAISHESKEFKVAVRFEGSKSGGIEIESLSRGDIVTVKGKVDQIDRKQGGLLENGVLLSVSRR